MEYQKTAEATEDLIDNKIANAVRSKTLAMPANFYDSKITKGSRSSPQNNSKTITNEHDKDIPKERYISPEERQKIIHNLILI